jgi:hypothetical protein
MLLYVLQCLEIVQRIISIVIKGLDCFILFSSIIKCRKMEMNVEGENEKSLE